MEELLPKDRNSRVMQVFGADGKVQSSRNREYDTPSAVQRQEHLWEGSSRPRSISLVSSCNLYSMTFWVALGH